MAKAHCLQCRKYRTLAGLDYKYCPRCKEIWLVRQRKQAAKHQVKRNGK